MYKEIKGLTDDEVIAARKQYGSNEFRYKKENRLRFFLLSIIREPMVVLLLAAAVIYGINGETGDSIFLGAAILLVATISWYQERRSRNALDAVEKLSQPLCKVIRNGKEEKIRSDDLVVGDVVILEEGSIVPADGIIIRSHDFFLNESMLTGESLPLYKSEDAEDRFVYKGTTVTGGLALTTLTATGSRTRLGRLGASLGQIKQEASPLEIRVRSFIKKMVLAGIAVFLIVWSINFYRDARLLDSLLRSLTLAMSILPEEIPVAFTSFMALAAFRLIKRGIVLKQMKAVETLGSATVICTDKTGTITQNRMALAALYEIQTAQIHNPDQVLNDNELELIRVAMWASEPLPFDPMEIALHEAYERLAGKDERSEYNLIHEYPLGGRPPMMTHIFENKERQYIIAAKGAPEALMAVSDLDPDAKARIQQAIDQLGQQGYRLLGVGTANYQGYAFPSDQRDFPFSFKGIVAFHDPPKENIAQVLQDFYRAGVIVKIITGDNAATTQAIARSIGFIGYEQSIEGDALMKLSDQELEQRVSGIYIYSRMFPEAKLRVINALKHTGAIVAMTGDGINDGPALKAAHIGVAMGKKGTEVARQAAAVILMDDDLSAMVDAIAMGRRLHANLKKAIRYIISIHIPIIMSVFVPLALGWRYLNILSPLHVIFLELIMGPTCSVIYENEPMEANAMQQKPRSYNSTFLSYKELALSVVQGLVIAVAVLAAYRYGIYIGYDEPVIRTLVFMVLVSANILLTLVNRSFYYGLWTTLQYRNNLVPFIIIITVMLIIVIMLIPSLRHFFGLTIINPVDYSGSIILGALSVIWMEVLKWFSRRKKVHQDMA